MRLLGRLRDHGISVDCHVIPGFRRGKRKGDRVIENSRTGEQIDFEIRTPEVLSMLSTWTRPGHRTPEHMHPEMEESFEILSGKAAFRIGGTETVAAPGEIIVVPPGTPHLAWNPTDGPVGLRITMRPALRWAEFTERLFAGENPVELLERFSREVTLAPR
jgi:quercetin dioxygenase-like cupin family protein